MKQSALYFIAAALCALAAAVNLAADRDIPLRILLYLAAGGALLWLGLKSRRAGT